VLLAANNHPLRLTDTLVIARSVLPIRSGVFSPDWQTGDLTLAFEAQHFR